MSLMRKIIVFLEIFINWKNKKFQNQVVEYTCNSPIVLCFHDITSSDDLYSLDVESFENFIKTSHFPFVSIDKAQMNPNEKGFVITFDDGYESVFSNAFPILKKYKVPFVAYIATDFIGKKSYITEDQIKEMSKDPLCTIGSHMCTHRQTRNMTNEEIQEEWIKSKSILENIIEKKVEHAALPYGSLQACSLKSIKLGLKNGYSTVATTQMVPYRGGSVIPRYVYQKSKHSQFIRVK